MSERLSDDELKILGLPTNESSPVFQAPWEASAFGIVVSLYQAGTFEWRDWVELLAAEIAAAPPDSTGERYYECWSRALEKLVSRLGLATPVAIDERAERWKEAYLDTPHGEPVELGRAG